MFFARFLVLCAAGSFLPRTRSELASSLGDCQDMELASKLSVSFRAEEKSLWQRGIARQVFQATSSSILDQPFLRQRALQPDWGLDFLAKATFSELAAAPTRYELALPASFRGRREGDGKDWKTEEEARRATAVKRWVLILQTCSESSTTAKQIESASQSKAEQVVGDCLRDKATSTILARAGSVLKYSRWLSARGKGVPLPWSEEDVYEYLSSALQRKASAAEGQALLQAVGFTLGVFNVGNADVLLASRRCKGAALRSASSKRKLVQRSPLTVAQVESLELLMAEENTSSTVRVFVGAWLFMVHSSARFSDLFFCADEPALDLDETGENGYAEVGALHTKTSNRSERRRRALPLVAHAKGTSGVLWAKWWLGARMICGLRIAQGGGPLIPALSRTGTWTSSRMRSGEAILWMTEILRSRGPLIAVSQGQVFGTHSAKATLLSWAAKAGVPAADRKFLGHHCNGQEETVLAYSRDSMAGPLRRLRVVLDDIAARRFLPDSTRSGRWVELDAVQKPSDERVVRAALIARHGPDVGRPSPSDLLADSEEVAWYRGERPRSSSAAAVDVDGDLALPVGEGDVVAVDKGAGVSVGFDWFGDGDVFGPVRHDADAALGSCELGEEEDPVIDQPVCLSDSEVDSGSSCSSSTESADSSDDERAAESLAKRRRKGAAEGSLGPYFQHRVLRTLHVGGRVRGILACGRRAGPGSGFEELAVLPAFDWPRCKVCWGQQPS
jgi:hypothetical protein